MEKSKGFFYWHKTLILCNKKHPTSISTCEMPDFTSLASSDKSRVEPGQCHHLPLGFTIALILRILKPQIHYNIIT